MLETSIVNFGRVLSDLEIIEIVGSELSNITCTFQTAMVYWLTDGAIRTHILMGRLAPIFATVNNVWLYDIE